MQRHIIQCLLCLYVNLYVVGKVVSWERWESIGLGKCECGEGSELESWERCVRVVRWQGGKSGRVVR